MVVVITYSFFTCWFYTRVYICALPFTYVKEHSYINDQKYQNSNIPIQDKVDC